MRLPREEARREDKIKGVYSRFILARLKSPILSAVKNIAKWTFTGMYLPIRLILCLYGMEWVWGICIGVGSALLLTARCLAIPGPEVATVTDTHSFFIPVANGVIGDDKMTNSIAVMKAIDKEKLIDRIRSIEGRPTMHVRHFSACYANARPTAWYGKTSRRRWRNGCVPSFPF